MDSLSILGSCISRDSFDFNKGYLISRTLINVSPLAVLNEPLVDWRKNHEFPDITNFKKRCTKIESSGRRMHVMAAEADIKIFVSHSIDIDSKTVDCPLFYPVRCGAVYDKRNSVYIPGDDTGDNISDKGISYSALTVQYWAWKNIKADYYGLCYYNGYLSFADNPFGSPDKFEQVIERQLNSEAIARHHLDEESIRRILGHNDVVCATPSDISKWTDASNIYKLFENNNLAFPMEAVDIYIKTFKKLYPEYTKDIDEYFGGNKWWVNNTYVLKKELFYQYNEMLFNILSEVESILDTSLYSKEQLRIYEQMGIFTFAVFYIHIAESGFYRLKELNVVRFSDTNKPVIYEPAFKINNVAITVTSSGFFAPYFGVLLESIIDNASAENNYDIIVLEDVIKEGDKAILLHIVGRYANFSLRFIDVSSSLNSYDFRGLYGHVTKHTYARLFIPQLFANYDKIIYIDSDTVVNHDIAELYYTDLGDNYLGAVRDQWALGMYNMGIEHMVKCIDEVLHLKHPDDYFNAGVMLLNLKMFKQNFTTEFLLNMALSRDWTTVDQDILNLLCQDKVLFLDDRWNVLPEARFNQYSSYIRYNQWLEARDDPYIVHYAGNNLPVIQPNIEHYELFWKYAKNTPFYEQLMSRLSENRAVAIFNKKIKPVNDKVRQLGTEDKRSKTRNLADRLCPKGSKRRTLAKKILPWHSLRRSFFAELFKKIRGKDNIFNHAWFHVKIRIKNCLTPLVSWIPGLPAFRYRQIIRQYKNKYKDQRCFFVGLGNSLTIEDLDKLKGEITFSTNNVYPLLDKTDWKPTYYFMQDVMLPWVVDFEEVKKKIVMPHVTQMSFYPLCPYARKVKELDKKSSFLPIVFDYAQTYKEMPYVFSRNCEKKVSAAYISAYTVMQMMVYMGFKEIYLIGCDAFYSLEQAHCYDNKDDLIEINDSVITRSNVNVHYGYRAIKEAIDKIPGVTIYNATRGGKLELFPRVDLDEVLGLKDKQEEM